MFVSPQEILEMTWKKKIIAIHSFRGNFNIKKQKFIFTAKKSDEPAQ